MIFTVALPGTLLANVRYQWLVAGALGGALSSGITAVDALFPYEFRIDASPPTDFEELYAYDVTDATNYTKGKPQIATTLVPPTNFDLLDIDGGGRVNVGKMNDQSLLGTGQPGDLWRGS